MGELIDGDGSGHGSGHGCGIEMLAGQLREFIVALVDSGSLMAQHALTEENTELRRLIIECLGADRFFREALVETVHQDIDGHGHPRRLVRMPVTDAAAGYLQAVHVICPTTGREYYLGVPPDVKTCQEAVASTFGLQASEYHPVRES